MKFDLKRPCAHCPFRCDIRPFLTAERVEGIEESLVRSTFACHETTEYVEDDEGGGDLAATADSQHCAGALILMEKEGRPSQMMRIAERLGMYDHTNLDMTAPVFNTFEDMINAQEQD